jgi:hypothetical protein
MPSIIDPETMNVDTLPGIWTPVQWPQTKEERLEEMEIQAAASLLFAVDAPEAILRLLLNETEIERAFDPPAGYDPEQQGDWDHKLVTFQFTREIRLEKVERSPVRLYVEYKFGELGYWALEIEAESVKIYRL